MLIYLLRHGLTQDNQEKRYQGKNLRALMQYAGMFKVEKILRQYLEVLL